MTGSSRKISRSQSLIGALAAIFVLSSCNGPENIFEQKPTEIQSDHIIRDLSQVKEIPDVNRPLPDIYLAEPKIVSTKDGVKLFYFSKQHTVDKLSAIVKEQLGYKTSQNPATNQLIIQCKTEEEAQAAIDFLKEVDVPPIQVRIHCLISQLYGDKTMDRETTLLIREFFGEPISLGGQEVGLLDEVFWPHPDVPVTEVLPAFPGASIRDMGRSKMGLKVGYWRKRGTDEEFRAVVDILESKGYLKILMDTQLEVINGRKATIKTSESVPLPKEVSRPADLFRGVYPYTITEYKDVIDCLEITPQAFADGSIGLETKAVISSKRVPEGVKQIPILTSREVNVEENRIRPGDSMVIGGVKKSEKWSVVRGVPLLKDIPVLGVLFSSKDFEERGTEVIFIITPSISTGGIPHKEMIEQVKRKHELPADEASEPEADESEQQRKTEEAALAPPESAMGQQQAETVAEANQPAPKITFEKVVHDFGEVAPGTKQVSEFKFTNAGEGSLKITEIKTCCGIVAELAKKEYAPGESGALKVQYRSSSRPGTVSGTLYVSSNDEANTNVALTIKAKIVPKVGYEPETLSLSLKDENAGCPKITLTSLDNQPFSIKTFTSTGECITADVDPSVEATKFVLEAKVDLEKLQRNPNGVINIELTHPQCDRVSISFNALPKFKITPPQIMVFNAEPEKPTVTKVSVLSNYGDDFEVESASSENNFIKVLSQEKVPNGYEFELEVTPPVRQDEQSMFTDVFSVNIKGGEQLPIRCQGLYLKEEVSNSQSAAQQNAS